MISFNRIGLVAGREFLVTISSKGFLFGVLVMPLLMVVLLSTLPKMMRDRGARVDVEVALIDRSGALAGSLRTELDPATIERRRVAVQRAIADQLGRAGEKAAATVEATQPQIPHFKLRELPADASLDAEKAWLTDEKIGRRERRALVVIPAAAVARADGGVYETYELYAPRNLPEDAESTLHNALRQSVIAERLRETGVDPAVVRDATQIDRVRTVVVSADGRQQGTQGLNRALPFIMGVLLFMGVMTGGQALMTSTVEEKSSRVVEVLLAAVSPLELMWGKLLGQLGVGLLMLAVYVGIGVLALLQFALFGLVDPLLILYLFIFFLMAYLVYGALMQMIGAAVNQMADAQSLMGPLMLLLVVPYVLTVFIGSQPDAPFAVIMSFVPPVNAFGMMARLASSSPPPLWQVLVSMALSLVAACVTVWFAAKVFRVGLLMHGKPPSFRTLIKWARMS
jgi:ABC-2 type transport system permease protein